ncbi:hypothetical protein O6H91_01G054900 [Diphasiastrum complanatum]|uniref:Uncharacterized protein n=1 Tax=Diphasiastrum complanatum TaxID=34168 RepID=A0ACC2EQW3_DIPCM|nr:hypothetical protein O6H91_01G054900 [Diphasiastrum complanatum]
MWHQEQCTNTGLKDPNNKFKPMFLKELSKLWTKLKPELPWEEGEYGPTNTLLVDDTPYKAICNPPYTAIFPMSYTANSRADDFLVGQLKSYLQQLLCAMDVQRFVKENSFGQPHVSPQSPLWNHCIHCMYVQTCAETQYSDA